MEHSMVACSTFSRGETWSKSHRRIARVAQQLARGALAGGRKKLPTLGGLPLRPAGAR